MMLPRWLTGGRPMRRIGYGFIDIVGGYPVYLFEDRYGRTWLARRPWAYFRIAPTFETELWDDRQ